MKNLWMESREKSKKRVNSNLTWKEERNGSFDSFKKKKEKNIKRVSFKRKKRLEMWWKQTLRCFCPIYGQIDIEIPLESCTNLQNVRCPKRGLTF